MENRIIDPMTIGRRLTMMRGDKGRSKVAREIGISVSRLFNYEAGIRIPNDEAKVLLANYYGVTVQELFFDTNYNETL